MYFEDREEPQFIDWFEWLEDEQREEILEMLFDLNEGFGNDFGAWKGNLSEAEVETLCKEYYTNNEDFTDYFKAYDADLDCEKGEVLYRNWMAERDYN